MNVFYLHYNKPASRLARKPLLSVHYKKKCFVVDHVDCRVPMRSKHQKRQPFCILKGKCSSIIFNEEQPGLTTALIL